MRIVSLKSTVFVIYFRIEGQAENEMLRDVCFALHCKVNCRSHMIFFLKDKFDTINWVPPFVHCLAHIVIGPRNACVYKGVS